MRIVFYASMYCTYRSGGSWDGSNVVFIHIFDVFVTLVNFVVTFELLFFIVTTDRWEKRRSLRNQGPTSISGPTIIIALFIDNHLSISPLIPIHPSSVVGRSFTWPSESVDVCLASYQMQKTRNSLSCVM